MPNRDHAELALLPPVSPSQIELGFSQEGNEERSDALCGYDPQRAGTDGIFDYDIVRLFKTEDLKRLHASQSNSRDRDSINLMSQTVERLASRGENRYLEPLVGRHREKLNQMKEKFPNFLEVIDYIECCAELAWRTDQILRFTPILLAGPGGVGKTKFVEIFASWCTSSFYRVSIATSQSGSDLAGASSFWSNATPGMVFDALVNNDFANPLFFLDEIDKASTGDRYNPLGALYVLLENSSAKTFTDECYNLPLDASHIMYIAACNEADQIPAPLRTRFREFDISLTREHSRKIANQIVQNTLIELRPATNGMLFSEDAIESLVDMTPRKIGQAVQEAIGRAFVNQVKLITSIPKRQVARRIGFLP